MSYPVWSSENIISWYIDYINFVSYIDYINLVSCVLWGSTETDMYIERIDWGSMHSLPSLFTSFLINTQNQMMQFDTGIQEVFHDIRCQLAKNWSPLSRNLEFLIKYPILMQWFGFISNSCRVWTYYNSNRCSRGKYLSEFDPISTILVIS